MNGRDARVCLQCRSRIDRQSHSASGTRQGQEGRGSIGLGDSSRDRGARVEEGLILKVICQSCTMEESGRGVPSARCGDVRGGPVTG